MNYIIPTIEELFRLLGDFLHMLYIELFTDTTVNHDYKSEFVTIDDVLSKSNRGFCLDGRRSLIRKTPNVMVLAPSGSGKTTVTSIPSILKIEGSIIINDPSKEQYLKTSGYLTSQGYDIQVVNFAEPTGTFYNPMARINDAADAQKVANMLVRNVLHNPNDPFWSLSATNLISLVIRVLLCYDKSYQNFANVRHVVQMFVIDTAQADRLVANTKRQDIINDYKNFISQDNKLKTSVVATSMTALQIFADPIVADVTSKDTLNLESLRVKKTAIFLHSNTSDMQYYSALISIFFEQSTKALMTNLPSEKEPYYVFYILDELSSLYLPSLENMVANCRKYNINIMCILQSFQQLIAIYGKERADSIRMNCYAKVYFPGMDFITSEELSKQLGKYTYFEDEEGKRKSVRELMTSDELRTMDSNNAVLIAGNNQPMKLKLTPYYENPFLKMKTNIPAPKFSSTESELISYIEA